MSAPIRVVVVDDDPMVRTGLRLILGGNSGIEIVAEAVDGQDAVQVVTRTRPDVVLMDIRMPRRDGLSATVELLALSDPPRILVLTTFDTDELVLKALRAGAAGFLLKDTPPAQLVQAVRSVAAGQPSLSPSVTAQLIAALAHPETIEAESSRVQAQARLADLTERELEVAATRTVRSPRSCLCQSRPSRRTSGGSSPSSVSTTGCRSRFWSTTRTSRVSARACRHRPVQRGL